MKEINAVFLAETGITSTSANHLANIAQETIVAHQAQLQHINFVTTTLDIVGSQATGGKVIAQGYSSERVAEVPQLLEEMAQMNAFCAWVREAIRAKEREQEEVLATTFEEWCEREGHTLPTYPYLETLTEETVLAKLNIKERNRYLQLEAAAATIGKFVHPGRELSKAREELRAAEMKPHSTKGEGANTLIYHYEPSISGQEVEELFFQLQSRHRELEKELNQMKWQLKQDLNELQLAHNSSVREEQTKVSERVQELQAAFNSWQTKEHARVSRLKIAIPEALQPTLERLNKLSEQAKK